MLDTLGSKLKDTLGKISKSLFVDEKLLDEVVRDIQRAMLQADVNVQLVLSLTKKIKERAKKEESGLNKKEQLVTIIYEELVSFFGTKKELSFQTETTRIMLVGLYGSGKTTTTGKLASYYKKRGKKVAVVGLDVHRPAAMQQLEQVAKQADVDCYISPGEKDPIAIWKSLENKVDNYDVVFIDTAGRDALSSELIKEIEEVTEAIQPQEKLLVISGDIGQAAQKQAQQFHDSCGITGVIVTKMDGTAKGGGALTACAITESPILFVGVGEKLDALETFNPEGFVSRLLGMGDIEALLEKAKTAIKEEDAEDLSAKFMKGDFDLTDLHQQMQALKKMGSMSKMMEMIPGMGKLKMPKEMLDVQEEKMEKWKYIISSCTEEEKKNPDVMSGSRVERIAKGSGTTTHEVRDLLKHYKQSKKMMKKFGGSEKKMEKMMKKFGGM